MFQSYAELKSRLAQSRFRSRFKLNKMQQLYVVEKGEFVLRAQAEKIIRERLSAANPVNDGSQTPMRGHVVFIAQHATGCCCRSCLFKWHHIAPGRPLSEDEIAYIVNILLAWIGDHVKSGAELPHTPDLFDL